MRTQMDLHAADVMTREMITVPATASIREAAAVLVDREISGAPVRDELGRIIGVVSLRDIARFERERSGFEPPDEKDMEVVPGLTAAESRSSTRPNPESAEDLAGRVSVPYGFHLEMEEPVSVRDVMSPASVTVPGDADLYQVAQTMVRQRQHRVLVRDTRGEIVGLISALDLVRLLAGVTTEPQTRVRSRTA